MNIAILIPNLVGGGAERSAVLLGDYYYDKGHNVYYFIAESLAKSKYKTKGKIINTHIYLDFLNSDSLSHVMHKLLLNSIVIRKLKKIYKIDVAISYMEVFNYINILSKCGERNIVSVHTVLSKRKDFDSIIYNPKLVRFMYNISDTIVTVSNAAKNDLIYNYKVNKTKVHMIPNAYVNLHSYPSEQKWEFGEKTIIAVGWLETVKQHERIIRAFSYAAKKEPSARLIILGYGSRKSYLLNLINDLGLHDKVFLLGFRQNVGFYLQNSKVFVMSSITEGFGNSMIEAMSYGLPVVSIDSPGGCWDILGRKIDAPAITDISFEKYGIITPYITGNITNQNILDKKEILFGKAMLMLLENNKLYDKYSKLSFKRSNDYTLEKIMRHWNKIVL